MRLFIFGFRIMFFVLVTSIVSVPSNSTNVSLEPPPSCFLYFTLLQPGFPTPILFKQWTKLYRSCSGCLLPALHNFLYSLVTLKKSRLLCLTLPMQIDQKKTENINYVRYVSADTALLINFSLLLVHQEPFVNAWPNSSCFFAPAQSAFSTNFTRKFLHRTLQKMSHSPSTTLFSLSSFENDLCFDNPFCLFSVLPNLPLQFIVREL